MMPKFQVMEANFHEKLVEISFSEIPIHQSGIYIRLNEGVIHHKTFTTCYERNMKKI